MNITTVKVRDLLFVVMGLLAILGTIANLLLLLTVWEQYQNLHSSIAFYKLLGSLTLAGISGVVVIAAVLVVLKSMSLPLKTLTSLMMDISNKNLDVDVPYQNQKNEFGDMARTLKGFRDKLKENEDLHREQLEASRMREERAQKLEESISQFDGHAQRFTLGIRKSMEDLGNTAGDLTTIAHEGLGSAEEMQSIAQKTFENIENVRDCATEMLRSIHHVSENISNSTTISQEATDKVHETSKSIEDLQIAAEEIGSVVTVINTIAKETNMLALNATIEAERAGPAGKGFAVVASEVKGLATETAKATEEIREKIDSVKESVLKTVRQIEDVGTAVQRVNDVLEDVSQSMNAQQEMSETISESAKSAAFVSEKALGEADRIYKGAQETEKSAGLLGSVSQTLSQTTDKLCAELKAFFSAIK